MNEKIDLTKILKDCPKGTKLYSTIYGEVEFYDIIESSFYSIMLRTDHGLRTCVTKYGMYAINYESKGECTLFPSKEQRDWNKFSAPWYKKENKRFDPKILKPFDRVLVKDELKGEWGGAFFSHINEYIDDSKYCTLDDNYMFCIPYNEDTKHLICTTDEAPEFYRYWED